MANERDQELESLRQQVRLTNALLFFIVCTMPGVAGAFAFATPFLLIAGAILLGLYLIGILSVFCLWGGDALVRALNAIANRSTVPDLVWTVIGIVCAIFFLVGPALAVAAFNWLTS